MARIEVTPEQVEAARIEVDAFRSAGLKPDPLVDRLAHLKLKLNDAFGDDQLYPNGSMARYTMNEPVHVGHLGEHETAELRHLVSKPEKKESEGKSVLDFFRGLARTARLAAGVFRYQVELSKTHRGLHVLDEDLRRRPLQRNPVQELSARERAQQRAREKQ